MSDQRKILIKREELYERICQIPAKRLAAEYKISPTRLAVICQKLNVPKPSPGYCMKVKHGKKIRRPPLPPLGPGERVEFEHIVGESHKRPVENDPTLLALLDKVPAIKVPLRLNDPDPLIKNARAWIRSQPFMYSEPNRLPHLSLNVYPNSVGRALRIMDALVKGFKKLGYEVRGEDESNEVMSRNVRRFGAIVAHFS